MVLLSIGNEFLSAFHAPLAPGRNDLHVRLERKVGELETDLVVPLARCPMADSVRTFLICDLDLALGNKRPGNRGPEEISALVHGVRPQHGEHEIPDEFLAQVIDVDLARAGTDSLLTKRLKLLALADIRGECYHFGAILLFKPGDDDRCIEPA